MQQKKSDFFIIGTGKNTSVEEFTKECFKYIGLNYKKYLKIDKKLLRSNKTRNLKANLSKTRKILKFRAKTDIKELIKIMMDDELTKYND